LTFQNFCHDASARAEAAVAAVRTPDPLVVVPADHHEVAALVRAHRQRLVALERVRCTVKVLPMNKRKIRF
jgi:hypothetical protein